MRWRCAIVLLAGAGWLAGCGRFDFDRTATQRDAAIALDSSAPDADTDAGVDSSLDSGDTARPCTGTTHTVIDNFDDDTRDTALWGNAYNDNLTTYSETGGRLTITLGASSPDDWAGYMTTTDYELADDRAFVEVLQVSASGTNTVLMLFTSLAQTDGPSIEYDAGNLVFRRRIGGVINDLGSVPYDPIAHRWWQIRERDDITYWELSPDGIMWTVGYQEPSATVTTGFIALAAGTNSPVANAGTAIFDNVNGGGAPPSCP